jgi:hypothetical protein
MRSLRTAPLGVCQDKEYAERDKSIREREMRDDDLRFRLNYLRALRLVLILIDGVSGMSLHGAPRRMPYR